MKVKGLVGQWRRKDDSANSESGEPGWETYDEGGVRPAGATGGGRGEG